MKSVYDYVMVVCLVSPCSVWNWPSRKREKASSWQQHRLELLPSLPVHTVGEH